MQNDEGEINFDELAHEKALTEDLADRLRDRDQRILKLTKLLIKNGIEINED